MFKIKKTSKPRDIFNDVMFTVNEDSNYIYIIKYIKSADNYKIFNTEDKIDLNSPRGTRTLENVINQFVIGHWVRVKN